MAQSVCNTMYCGWFLVAWYKSSGCVCRPCVCVFDLRYTTSLHASFTPHHHATTTTPPNNRRYYHRTTTPSVPHETTLTISSLTPSLPHHHFHQRPPDDAHRIHRTPHPAPLPLGSPSPPSSLRLGRRGRPASRIVQRLLRVISWVLVVLAGAGAVVV